MDKMSKQPKKWLVDRLKGYEKEYYLKYNNVIPWYWGGVKPEDREKVYKQALEEGKTWERVTGFDKMPKDVIL